MKRAFRNFFDKVHRTPNNRHFGVYHNTQFAIDEPSRAKVLERTLQDDCVEQSVNFELGAFTLTSIDEIKVD